MRGVARFRASLVHLATLRVASLVVPRERRAEWLAEWRTELWYAARECRCRPAVRRIGCSPLTAFCLGSYRDALWLRRNTPPPEEPAKRWLESPMQCIGLLVALAALSVAAALFLWPQTHNLTPSVDIQESFAAFRYVLIFGCSILPAFTSLSLGEVSGYAKGISCVGGFRRWIFLFAKIVLILVMVYCGSLIFTYSDVPAALRLLDLHVTILGCTFALRWALNDQRHRCPECLRLLAQPVWVGDRSRYFLEWNCTELVCPRAHGLMYVPERPASWFSTQRWLRLDSSWNVLLPAHSRLNHLS